MWNRIIGLVGPTGSGKSHESARLMAQCERAAVYQLVRPDTNFLGAATDIFDGDIKAFCRALGEDNFRLIYKVSADSKRVEGNRFTLTDFEPFIKCCFERGQMTMLIDEAHFLCNPRYIPQFFWESIVTGRHNYIDIVYITQRMSMVHHDITANTHEFRFWTITEPADLEAIRARCGDEVRDKVASLRPTIDNRRFGGGVQPGEMFVWNKQQGEQSYDGNSRSTAGNAGSGEQANDAQVQPVPD